LKHENQVEQVQEILELVQGDDQEAALKAAQNLVTIIQLDNDDSILCRMECIAKEDKNGEIITQTILSGLTRNELPKYYKKNSTFLGMRFLAMEAIHRANKTPVNQYLEQ